MFRKAYYKDYLQNFSIMSKKYLVYGLGRNGGRQLNCV